MKPIDKTAKMCIIAASKRSGTDKGSHTLFSARLYNGIQQAQRQRGGGLPRRVAALFCVNGGAFS